MTYTGGFKAGETKDFVLGYNNRGRYVTIQLLDQNFLTLCEVEVFAARRKSIHFIQCNHGQFGHNRPFRQLKSETGESCLFW